MPFLPVVVEALREQITDHMCHGSKRATQIGQHCPHYQIEAELTENDELWTGQYWENNADHMIRKYEFLEHVFLTDDSVFNAAQSRFSLQQSVCLRDADILRLRRLLSPRIHFSSAGLHAAPFSDYRRNAVMIARKQLPGKKTGHDQT